MCILAAMMAHENNLFSPVGADLALHFPLDGEDVTTPDDRALKCRHLRRPIFPLDPAKTILFPLSKA